MYRLIFIAVLLATPLAQAEPHTYIPPKGFVPDAQTAIAIAVAVLTPIYGQEKIAHEQPFKATLVDGVWFVEGSLPWAWLGATGGTAEAEISQQDGRILRVTHGK